MSGPVGLMKGVWHFLIARLAYHYYGRPARKMITIGVTGTKGKSTTARLIASVLEAAGYKVGLLTTVELQIGDRRQPNKAKMTMLGRGRVQQLLKKMVEAGCKYAVVEVSSEGILQHRHYGLDLDVSVFTNLASEHAERHGGFENLKRDKGKIFASLKNQPHKLLLGKKVPKIIVANCDDRNGEYYLGFVADAKYVFGIECKIPELPVRSPEMGKPAEAFEELKGVVGSSVQVARKGTSFVVDGKTYNLQLIGEFNVYNALAAIAVGRSQGLADEAMATGLNNVDLVPGRMEFIDEGQNFTAIVDYAHEPLSLGELFKTLRQLAGDSGRIIAVIGSDGGGRDRGKRKQMGYVSGQLADIIFITDVNCFDEDPAEIAEMLAVGSRQAGKKDNVNLFIEVDRGKAIAQALATAQAGDVVAITAKGAEPVIAVANGKTVKWDDREETRKALQKLKTNKS